MEILLNKLACAHSDTPWLTVAKFITVTQLAWDWIEAGSTDITWTVSEKQVYMLISLF